MWPSLLGGVNMYPNAYNPQTGNLYLAATNAGMKYGLEEIKVISNVRHFGAYQEFIWGNEIDKAVNVSTGAEVWRNELAKPGYAGGMLTTAGQHHGLHDPGRWLHGSQRQDRRECSTR